MFPLTTTPDTAFNVHQLLELKVLLLTECPPSLPALFWPTLDDDACSLHGNRLKYPPFPVSNQVHGT